MLIGYVAAAGGLAIVGQQSAADMLDAAMAGELPPPSAVLDQAGHVAGTGVSVATAAWIIGGAPIVFKLLQMVTPYTETLNLWWRKRLLGEDKTPPA